MLPLQRDCRYFPGLNVHFVGCLICLRQSIGKKLWHGYTWTEKLAVHLTAVIRQGKEGTICNPKSIVNDETLILFKCMSYYSNGNCISFIAQSLQFVQECTADLSHLSTASLLMCTWAFNTLLLIPLFPLLRAERAL